MPFPSQPKLVLIYRPRRDGRLSWPGWLVTYRNKCPALEELNPDTGTHLSTNRTRRMFRWSRPTRYRIRLPPYGPKHILISWTLQARLVSVTDIETDGQTLSYQMPHAATAYCVKASK